MCDGVGVLHSGQAFSLGARQRFAPRRNFDFILEVLRLGAAMVLTFWLVGVLFQAVDLVEGGPGIQCFLAGPP